MELSLDDPAVLLRPDVLDDPRPLYDLLRREAPVWQLPGQHTFVVADPELIRDVVGRPAEFSSNLVSLLHADEHLCPVPRDLVPLGDPIHVLATADPPVHTAHRKLLQPHLSPGALAGLEPTLRRLVDRQLSAVLDAGRGDIVAELGDPLPAMAICRLIGVPADDAPGLVPAVLATGALLDGVTDGAGMVRAGTAALELAAYARDRLEAARGQLPGERAGLLAAIVEGVETGVVSEDQARDILVQLFSAGTETTSSLIATAVETLARDPGWQDGLRRDPGRIPGAVEAVLADDAPFQFHYRFTTGDTALAGTTIPAHSRVLLMWAAANRPDPRDAGPGAGGPGTAGPATHGRAPDPGSHFAFGRGLHFCIGAPLARLEARVVLEELLARTSLVALDPDHPPTRRPSIFLRRHDRLEVVVERP